MREAIIYLRVSTLEQAREGLSLEAQEARARAHCEAKGYTVSAVYRDEGISGRKLRTRPQLQTALREVCEREAVLVIYSLSRMSRSTRDAINIMEKLRKAGADIVSLSESLDSDSATGRMMFKFLAVLAEFESELLAERVKSSFALKKERKEYLGGLRPFGFSIDRNGDKAKTRRNSEEQAAIRQILTLREGGATYRDIARELEAEGVQTSTGLKSWKATQVMRICKGKRHNGIAYH